MIGAMSFWDERLTADEIGALRPGRPADLRHNPDVLIIGGGVVGLATAAACVRAGLGHVVVLERDSRLVPAASGRNSGAIAPDMHVFTDSAEFVAFGRASRDRYATLDAEWDGAIGLTPTRWLNILAPDQAAEAGPMPSGFRLLDAAEVSELEPDVRLPDGGAAVLAAGQYGVNPQRLAVALAARSGQVATGATMLDVAVRGGKAVRVRTTGGDFSPGALVLATGLLPGPWASGVAQRWVKGHMVAVGPGLWELRSVLTGPLGGGTPLSDGTIICGGTFDPGDHTDETRTDVTDGLARSLTSVLPAAALAPVTHRWHCFRPYIEGRQPVIDRLPGVANGWFAGGHFTTGVMMAAETGAALACWLATGEPPAEIATFTLPAATAPDTAQPDETPPDSTPLGSTPPVGRG